MFRNQFYFAVIILNFLLFSCDNLEEKVTDVTPPTLYFVSPGHGSTVTSENIEVVISAQDKDSGISSVTINGEPAIEIEPNKYSANIVVPFLKGDLTLVAKAWNSSNINSNTTITVQADVNDKTLPELFVKDLKDNDIIEAETHTFSGYVRDNMSAMDSLKIYMDGKIVKEFAFENSQEKDQESFSYSHSFENSEGTHLLRFQAIDSSGNILQKDYTIVSDITTPEIKKIFPSSNTVSSEFMISAEAGDRGAGIKTVYSELNISNEEGTQVFFKSVLPLQKEDDECNEKKELCIYSVKVNSEVKKGVVRFKLAAVDFSNKSKILPEVTLSIDSLPPKVAIISPAGGSIVDDNNFTVHGIVKDDSHSVKSINIEVYVADKDGNPEDEPVATVNNVTLTPYKEFENSISFDSENFADREGHQKLIVKVFSVDNSGNSSSDEESVTLNRVPVITALYNNSEITDNPPLTTNENEIISFDIEIVDPDGDSLCPVTLLRAPAGAEIKESGDDFKYEWNTKYFQVGEFDTKFSVKDCLKLDGDGSDCTCRDQSEVIKSVKILVNKKDRSAESKIGKIRSEIMTDALYIPGSAVGFSQRGEDLCWVEPFNSLVTCKKETAIENIAGKGKIYPDTARDENGDPITFARASIRFIEPSDLLITLEDDSSHSYYISDRLSGYIWKINGDSAKIVAGGGSKSLLEDEMNPLDADILPNSLFLYNGEIGFTTSKSHQIALLKKDGDKFVIDVIAGKGIQGHDTSDNTPAENAFLSYPSSVTSSGDVLYFTDYLRKGHIKKIENGEITTLFEIDDKINSITILSDELFGAISYSDIGLSGIYKISLSDLSGNSPAFTTVELNRENVMNVRAVGDAVYYSDFKDGVIRKVDSSDTIGKEFSGGAISEIALVNPVALHKRENGTIVFDRGIQKILFYNPHETDSVTIEGITIEPGKIEIIGGTGGWNADVCQYNGESIKDIKIKLSDKVHLAADGNELYFTNCNGISKLSFDDWTIETISTGENSSITDGTEARDLIVKNISAVHRFFTKIYLYSDGSIWHLNNNGDDGKIYHVAGNDYFGTVIEEDLFDASPIQNAYRNKDEFKLDNEVSAFSFAVNDILLLFAVPYKEGNEQKTKLFAYNNEEYPVTVFGKTVGILNSPELRVSLIAKIDGTVTDLKWNDGTLYYSLDKGGDVSVIKKIKGDETVADFNTLPDYISNIEKVGGFDFHEDEIVYVDKNSTSIFRCTTANCSSISGTDQFVTPEDITVSGNFLFVTDSGDHSVRKIELSSSGSFVSIEKIAGSSDGTPGNSGDGSFAENSKLDIPTSITMRGGVAVFVDKGNALIRAIETEGNTPTIASVPLAARFIDRILGGGDGIGEGAEIRSTKINSIHGLIYHGDALYFGDYANNIVRAVTDRNLNSTIDETDPVSTISGSKGINFSDGDGKTADEAKLFSISSILSSDNKRYIVEGFDSLKEFEQAKIRVIDSDNVILCYAGCGTADISEGADFYSVALPELIPTIAASDINDFIFYTPNIDGEELYENKVILLSGLGKIYFFDTVPGYIKFISIDNEDGSFSVITDDGQIVKTGF